MKNIQNNSEIMAGSVEQPSIPAITAAAPFRARVGVMESKFTKGANTIDDANNPKALIPALLLADALKTKWDTDAHLVMYSVPGVNSVMRFNKAMAASAKPGEIQMGVIFLDIDNTDENGAKKELKTWEEREAFLKKATDAAAQIGGEFAKWRATHTTKNGARLVFELTAPVSPNEAEEIMLGMHAALKKVGIQADESCKDWTRLFRLPYVVRDGKDTSEDTILICRDDAPSADPAGLPRITKGHQPAPRKAVKNDTASAPSAAQHDIDGPGEATMQDIRAALYGCDLHAIAFGDDLIAPVNGPGRNTNIVKYCGMAVQKLIGVPGMTRTQVCNILRPHVQKLAPDTGADAGAWEKLMEKMVREFWDRDVAAGKKSAPAKKAAKSAQVKSDGECPMPAEGDILLPSQAPKDMAEFFLREYAKWHFAIWRGTFYCYKNGFYAECDEDEVDHLVRRFLEKCVFLSKEGDLMPLMVDIKKVKETVASMKAKVRLPSTLEMPSWRDGRKEGVKPEDVVVLRNGLFDTATGRFMPSDPMFFSVGGSDFNYDASANSPERFLAFLAPWFADDPSGKGVRVIQQFAGLMLASTLGFQKALYVVGAPGNGKGVLFAVLRWLVGMDASASPTIGSLSKDEGLEELVGRKAGFIADATFDSNLDKQGALTANLLNIIAGDHTQFNRKYKRHWRGRLSTRLAFASNMPPKFHDASGAMARRLVIIQLNDSKPKEVMGNYEETFREELPAIFNWAVAGLSELKRVGRFEEPESSAGLRGTMEATTAPIKQFLGDMCDLGPGYQVPINVLYQAWKNWREESGHKCSALPWFGRDLHEATRINVAGRHPKRYYPGIRIKPPAAPLTPPPVRGFSPGLMAVSFDDAVAAAAPSPAPLPVAVPVVPAEWEDADLEALAAGITK